jgi:uncharacterized membrane protein
MRGAMSAVGLVDCIVFGVAFLGWFWFGSVEFTLLRWITFTALALLTKVILILAMKLVQRWVAHGNKH